MDEVEFDKFADEYRDLHAANIKLSGESPEYFAEYKVADIAAELERDRAVARTALDFGAGVGYSVPFFARHLPSRARHVPRRLAQEPRARRRAARGCGRVSAISTAARIPYADGTFDVALASCVFHHIPHDEHVALLAEIRRVLDAGRPVVRVRAQSAEPADASRRQHLRVRRACGARAGADHAPPRARRRFCRGRRVATGFSSRMLCGACGRSKPSSSGCRSARSTTSRRGRRIDHAHVAHCRSAADSPAARLLADGRARIRVSRRLRAPARGARAAGLAHAAHDFATGGPFTARSLEASLRDVYQVSELEVVASDEHRR